MRRREAPGTKFRAQSAVARMKRSEIRELNRRHATRIALRSIRATLATLCNSLSNRLLVLLSLAKSYPCRVNRRITTLHPFEKVMLRTLEIPF